MNTNDEIELQQQEENIKSVAKEMSAMTSDDFNEVHAKVVEVCRFYDAKWHLAKLSEVENAHDLKIAHLEIWGNGLESENKSLQSQNLRMREALEQIVTLTDEACPAYCKGGFIERGRHNPDCPHDYGDIAKEALKTP